MPKLRSRLKSTTASVPAPATLALSPNKTAEALDCGLTRVYDLIAQDELESYLDGARRKITVDSIHKYIARRLEASRGRSVRLMPTRRTLDREESDAR